MTEEKTFLPLGSLVIIKGALKKLMIVNRANVVADNYFDYGAILYPEGMIDENLAYFNQEDILKVVSKAYSDDDDELMVEQLLQAKEEYLASRQKDDVEIVSEEVTIDFEKEEDPFASIRDMEGNE
ncbi:DUF4176 domain-containing protein [Lactococcus lactis]|jgi:Uncharacterized protein conserved in bacteria|uniref:DUF4176 domain-containing protein n=1 Tax=Lactococcus lactis TaxID=1358 RepID=UPI00241835B6|nr:DUF4176 domain-containing protein [Lactococcus lactis]MDG4967428.1 DUF4176 domain-containing protein [Lactococcus lactis]